MNYKAFTTSTEEVLNQAVPLRAVKQSGVGWGMKGNMATELNYIGTNNAMPLKFETGDIAVAEGLYAHAERMRITQTGSVGIGTNKPAALLHLKKGKTDTRELVRLEALPHKPYAAKVLVADEDGNIGYTAAISNVNTSTLSNIPVATATRTSRVMLVDEHGAISYVSIADLLLLAAK